jgi:CRISPR-associated protein Cst1
VALIRAYTSDWLYNAGLVGFINIIENNEEKVLIKKDYIEFDSELLDGFEKKYFNYFIQTYERFISYTKIIELEDYINDFDLNNITEASLKTLNEFIDDVKKKLTSNSYKSAYLVITDKSVDLESEAKELSKISKTKKQEYKYLIISINNEFVRLRKIINYLKINEVKEKIAAKNIIYDYIQPYWSDVSFLNKNNSKKDMYEEYNRHFISTTKEYLSHDTKVGRYSCYTCENKLPSLGEAFDLTWLTKMGADVSRKTSHFWNFNSDCYICPVCNLIYSCITAGFTNIKGNGIFVNDNTSVMALISANRNALSKESNIDNLEEEIYYNIASHLIQTNVEKAPKEIDNIQIVKFDVNNDSRPYTFNLLSKHILETMTNNRDALRILMKLKVKITDKYYINLYKEVIKALYEGKHLFYLISQLIYIELSKERKYMAPIFDILVINNSYLTRGGKRKMVPFNEIKNFRKYGSDLRKAYDGNQKLSGISYRLLNALKTKNVEKFMETLINSYMYHRKPIPPEFISALNDDERFQTIGYAFLIGLLGENEIRNDRDGVINEN